VEGLAELAFRRHHAQIYRYLRRKTGDPDRAEDLAQEVFADAAAALARGDWEPESMIAWLYTIAQRRFADEGRRRRRSWDGVPLDDVLDELPAPDYGADVAHALRDAIAKTQFLASGEAPRTATDVARWRRRLLRPLHALLPGGRRATP